MFSEDPAEKHLGSSLVYMGGHDRKYCLVECIIIGNRDGEDNVDPPPCIRMFRLAKFSLKIDKNGDVTTGDTRRVQYYKIPKKDMNGLTLLWPPAFWL